MSFFFDAKLRFALLASFWCGNNEPKRSEANQKISKKREAKLRVEEPKKNYFDPKLRFALFTYFLTRFALAQYFRIEMELKARSEASRQKKT